MKSLNPEGLEQQPGMFGLKGALGSTVLPEPGVTRPGGCLRKVDLLAVGRTGWREPGALTSLS